MKARLLGATIGICLTALVVHAEKSPFDGVKWQQGPSIGNLGSVAELHVPAGYVFAGANDTRIIMEAMQNPTTGNELGFIAPAGLDWFVVYEFNDVGYIRDDEKNSLDADAMLEGIKKGTEAGNIERRRRGWPPLTLLGWEQKPRYDEATHNLEWAFRATSEGKLVVNYNTRLLGRGGVMVLTLVCQPESLAQTLSPFKNVLAGYKFSQGHGYAEFRQGDKMAKYGLSALVVGGAAAVAVKTGLAKGLWKLIVVGFLVISAFFKKLFSRKKD